MRTTAINRSPRRKADRYAAMERKFRIQADFRICEDEYGRILDIRAQVTMRGAHDPDHSNGSSVVPDRAYYVHRFEMVDVTLLECLCGLAEFYGSTAFNVPSKPAIHLYRGHDCILRTAETCGIDPAGFVAEITPIGGMVLIDRRGKPFKFWLEPEPNGAVRQLC